MKAFWTYRNTEKLELIWTKPSHKIAIVLKLSLSSQPHYLNHGTEMIWPTVFCFSQGCHFRSNPLDNDALEQQVPLPPMANLKHISLSTSLKHNLKAFLAGRVVGLASFHCSIHEWDRNLGWLFNTWGSNRGNILKQTPTTVSLPSFGSLSGVGHCLLLFSACLPHLQQLFQDPCSNSSGPLRTLPLSLVPIHLKLTQATIFKSYANQEGNIFSMSSEPLPYSLLSQILTSSSHLRVNKQEEYLCQES